MDYGTPVGAIYCAGIASVVPKIKDFALGVSFALHSVNLTTSMIFGFVDVIQQLKASASA